MENNNVSYELLAMSNSDSLSDTPRPRSVSIVRKKRVRRRTKTSRNSTTSSTVPVVCTRNRLITISFIAAIILCWLVTLTWIAVALHFQTAHLESAIKGVAAGSQGVPDALQKCHSLSKELQNNQTNLFSQLAALSLQLSNFTTQISIVQGGLSSVEEKLKASPELVNVPHDLQALSGSVASFGSQIQDLQSTSEHLKDEHSTVLETMKALQMNISNLNKTISEFIKTPISMNDSNAINALEEEKKLEILVSALTSNVSLINDTLSKKFLWVQDDQRKDYRKIEDLRELGANASSQITTIHNAMSGQEKNFKEMEERFSNFTLEVDLFRTQANKQFVSFNERIKKLENSTVHIYDEMGYIKPPPHEAAEQNVTSVSTHRNLNSVLTNEHHITPGGNTTTN